MISRLQAVISHPKCHAWIELAGAGFASYDLAMCIGHPLLACAYMMMSIYLVIAGAWHLAE